MDLRFIFLPYLLKALEAVDYLATQVCKIFDRNANNVQASLGWEQEYFVVDNSVTMFDQI